MLAFSNFTVILSPDSESIFDLQYKEKDQLIGLPWHPNLDRVPCQLPFPVVTAHFKSLDHLGFFLLLQFELALKCYLQMLYLSFPIRL